MTADDALLELLTKLKARDYRFVAVTPETHARILARSTSGHPTLRDIFGWNRVFGEHQLDPKLLALLQSAGCLARLTEGLRSLVRVASLDNELFLHSSFPTTDHDAVFFGPDTYRFARFIRAQMPRLSQAERVVDMGSGSGVGGILLAKQVPSASVTLVDINPAAARLARINATFAGVCVDTNLDGSIPRECDLVVANPPYMIDNGRTYRDGGAMLGGEIACQWVDQSLRALVPGGTLLVYTGAAVVRGAIPLVEHIGSLCEESGAILHVEEVDPDVFGEELGRPEYEDVERIAVFQIIVVKRTRPEAPIHFGP